MKQLGKVKLTDEIIETIDIDNLSTDISVVNENVNILSNKVNSELTLLKDETRRLLDFSTYYSIDEQSKWILIIPNEDSYTEITCTYDEHDIHGNYTWKNSVGSYPRVKFYKGRLNINRTSTVSDIFETGLTNKDPTSRDPEKNNLGGPYENENVKAIFIPLVPGAIIPDGNHLLKSNDIIEYPNDTSSLVESQGIKSFVNSSIQNIAAFYITNSNNQPFETYTQLTSTTSADMYCGGKQWTPQRNDYCIVREDESVVEKGGHWTVDEQYRLQYAGFEENIFKWHNDGINIRYRISDGFVSFLSSGDGFKSVGLPANLNPLNGDEIPNFTDSSHSYVFTKQSSSKLPTSRYIYNPGVSAVSSEYDASKWEFQYTINDSGFTQEQLNAIDSGITKQKVEKIDSLNSLSSINNNEIANYVRTNVSNPTIGLGAQIKYEVQKTVGYGDDVMLEAGMSRDLAYCGAFGSSAHIKNTNSDNSTLSNAFQIGRGTNTVSDSLQFLSTQVVVDGKIPTDSLELKSADIISLGKNAKGNEFGDIAIGIGANTSTASHATAVGEQSKVYNLKHGGIALGFNAKVSAEYSCQIGGGTNNSVSSLQFINTTVVNSDGVIPTSSLELKTTIINALSDIQSITSFDASAIQTIVTALSNLYSAINS